MERRGFFRSLLGLAAMPFMPVEKIVEALKPKPKVWWATSSMDLWRVDHSSLFDVSNLYFTDSHVELTVGDSTSYVAGIDTSAKDEGFWKDATLEDIA